MIVGLTNGWQTETNKPMKLQIKTFGAFIILKYGIREIILHEMEYSSFKEEIFILRGENRVKIECEDISFLNFNLLYHKHIPFYNGTMNDILDIKPLLKKYTWSSKINLNYELTDERNEL